MFPAALVLALAGCAQTPAEKAARRLDAAKAFEQKKDYKRAILELRNALQSTPKSAEIYYELGRAYGATGDLQAAANAFQRSLSIDPDYKPAKLQLSELLAVDGASSLLGDTETRLKSLLQDSGPNSDALNALALTDLRLGKSEQARQTLLEATAKFPAQMTSAVLLAEIKLESKDVSGAEQTLKNLAQNAPRSVEAHTVLASFYTSQNRLAEAENELRQALAIAPNSETALAQMATLDFALGKKEEAEQTYKHLSGSGDKSFQSLYGLFLFQTGRKEEAIREFDRLAKADPADRSARTRLIAAYLSSNRKGEAEKVLETALQKNNRDLDALLQRGELYLADRKYAQAEADFNQVLHLKPNSPQIHYVVAKLRQAQGSTLQYRQELGETLRLNSGELGIRLELADSLLADHNAKAAITLLQEAPPDQQKTVAWVTKDNWALWGIGDFGQMRRGIDSGLGGHRTAELLLQDGLWKLRAGDPAGARSSLNEALQMNPSDLRSVGALRDTYLAQKNAPMALSVVKELAARNPHSAPIQSLLGMLLATEGDHNAARAALISAKQADPKSLEADLLLVQLDVADKNLEGAEKRLTELLAQQENNGVRLWLGNIQEMRGNHAAALEQFRKVVQADPGNAQALNNLAYLLLDYGKQPDEALKYAQQAVELAPGNKTFSDTLGWALYQKGLYSSAVTYFERASSDSQEVLYKYHLAMAYTKAGDPKRGRTTLEAALKLNANLPEAKIAREVVEGAAR
jgi:cellulose synthase operon protein C